METFNFNLRTKNMSLTKPEKEAMISYYKQLIVILEEFQKNPQVIPAYIQGLYQSIYELQNAKATEEKESTETTNKEA